MKEERMQILQMIKEGTVSPEEGATLLAALGSEKSERESGREQRTIEREIALKRRWLRIRVVDRESGRARVNLSIPIGLIEFGLNMVELGGLNLNAVREAIQGGAEGKILEVEEPDSNERVEIFVE